MSPIPSKPHTQTQFTLLNEIMRPIVSIQMSPIPFLGHIRKLTENSLYLMRPILLSDPNQVELFLPMN